MIFKENVTSENLKILSTRKQRIALNLVKNDFWLNTRKMIEHVLFKFNFMKTLKIIFN
jgi:hypothetical protein